MNEQFAGAALTAREDLAREPDYILGGAAIRPWCLEVACGYWRETLKRRVMRVLGALARARGDTVSRDDLIKSCWDGVIVSEDAIQRCIGRLRKVAAASGNVISIETMPAWVVASL